MTFKPPPPKCILCNPAQGSASIFSHDHPATIEAIMAGGETPDEGRIHVVAATGLELNDPIGLARAIKARINWGPHWDMIPGAEGSGLLGLVNRWATTRNRQGSR